MKVVLFILGLAFSHLSFSQSKVEVSKALEQMKSSGMFSAEQIEAAKKQLLNMNDKTYSQLLKKAKEKSQDPAIQKKAMELYKKQNTKN